MLKMEDIDKFAKLRGLEVQVVLYAGRHTADPWRLFFLRTFIVSLSMCPLTLRRWC